MTDSNLSEILEQAEFRSRLWGLLFAASGRECYPADPGAASLVLVAAKRLLSAVAGADSDAFAESLPHQPVVREGGITRFRENRVVLRIWRRSGLTLNEVMSWHATEGERMQFLELIGMPLDQKSFASGELRILFRKGGGSVGSTQI